MDLKNKAGIMAIIDEYGPDVAEEAGSDI